MEAIIFSSLQASGKTPFYEEPFLSTHVRITPGATASKRGRKGSKVGRLLKSTAA